LVPRQTGWPPGGSSRQPALAPARPRPQRPVRTASPDPQRGYRIAVRVEPVRYRRAQVALVGPTARPQWAVHQARRTDRVPRLGPTRRAGQAVGRRSGRPRPTEHRPTLHRPAGPPRPAPRDRPMRLPVPDRPGRWVRQAGPAAWARRRPDRPVRERPMKAASRASRHHRNIRLATVPPR